MFSSYCCAFQLMSNVTVKWHTFRCTTYILNLNHDKQMQMHKHNSFNLVCLYVYVCII